MLMRNSNRQIIHFQIYCQTEIGCNRLSMDQGENIALSSSEYLSGLVRINKGGPTLHPGDFPFIAVTITRLASVLGRGWIRRRYLGSMPVFRIATSRSVSLSDGKITVSRPAGFSIRDAAAVISSSVTAISCLAKARCELGFMRPEL